MIARRRARRHGVGGDSRVAAHALQRQRDPGVADAGLRGGAHAVAAGARPVARSGGLQLSAVEDVRRRRAAAEPAVRRRGSTGASCCALAAVAAAWIFTRRSLVRLPDAGRGTRARRRELRRHLGSRAPCGSGCWRAAPAPASPASTKSRDRSASCSRPIVAGIRVRRDHRRLRRPPAPGRHPVREPAHVAAVSRRRIRADGARSFRPPSPGCSRARCCSSCWASDVFIDYRLRFGRRGPRASAARDWCPRPARGR